MLKRVLAVVATWALLAGSVLAQNTLTISTNNTPIDRKALEALSQEAFHRVGVDFKLVSLPSERSLFAANEGEVDGEGLRIAGLGSQYPNLIQVPERYIGISFVAFGKDASVKMDKGWESLKPHSVAFITGWKLFEANVGNAANARTVNRIDKAEQMFRMLEGDRVDLALYTRADGLALVRSLGLEGKVAVLSPSLKDVDMYLYLHKKHEALVPKLAQALRAMKADGRYTRIMNALKVD